MSLLVYADAGLTQPLVDIDWGQVGLGIPAETTVYVVNADTVPLKLSVTQSTPVPPELASAMSLVSNYVDETLPPSTSLPVIFTLTISEAYAGGDFSFNIVIDPVAAGIGYLHVVTTPVQGFIYVDEREAVLGEVLLPLAEGIHDVSYGDVDRYVTPKSVLVHISAGVTTELAGIYRPVTTMSLGLPLMALGFVAVGAIMTTSGGGKKRQS